MPNTLVALYEGRLAQVNPHMVVRHCYQVNIPVPNIDLIISIFDTETNQPFAECYPVLNEAIAMIQREIVNSRSSVGNLLTCLVYVPYIVPHEK